MSKDPVMLAITCKKKVRKNAANAKSPGGFETEMLTMTENLKALSECNGRWVQQAIGKTKHRRLILDVDSSKSGVYGDQEGSKYNGQFGCVCYHPSFCV